MTLEIHSGLSVEVIEEERPARRFYAKVTSVGSRYVEGSSQQIEWAHLSAGNGDWGLTVTQRSIRMDPRPFVTLPAKTIADSGNKNAYRRSRHPEPEGDERMKYRPGRLMSTSGVYILDRCRVYSKVYEQSRFGYSTSRQRRLAPDWEVISFNDNNNTITIRSIIHWHDGEDFFTPKRPIYEALTLPAARFMRDVNNHLRVYIEEVQLVLKSKVITEGDHEVPMSHDRVEFVLGPFVQNNSAAQAAIRAATEAFNLNDGEIRTLHGFGSAIQFRVRPSQFARFLILRNNYGGTNDFKGLDPKLVPEVVPPAVMDVADRRNAVSLA